MGRALGVVVMGHRRAEDRHHAVTDVFVDGPPCSSRMPSTRSKKRPSSACRSSASSSPRKARVAGQIGEQDGDLTALAGGDSSRGGGLWYVGWRCIGAMVSGSRDRLEQLFSRAEWDAELS